MKSKRLKLSLLLLFVALLSWAFYPLFRSYDQSNTGSLKIVKAELERDHSNYWLTLHFKGEIPTQVPKNYGLVSDDGELIRGAAKVDCPIPNKFWLDRADIEQSLKLQVGEQTLQVKSNTGAPILENQESRLFRLSDWK